MKKLLQSSSIILINFIIPQLGLASDQYFTCPPLRIIIEEGWQKLNTATRAYYPAHYFRVSSSGQAFEYQKISYCVKTGALHANNENDAIRNAKVNVRLARRAISPYPKVTPSGAKECSYSGKITIIKAITPSNAEECFSA